MAAKRGPTLRAQWLGKQLREIREADGKTLKDVAQYMQRDPSSISRLEAGTHPARVPDVLAYVDLCGVSNKRERDALVQLARDVWQTGWWDRYLDVMPTSFLDRVWLESRASAIWSFHPAVVPGLLQVAPYAAEIIKSNDLNATDEYVRSGVELRLARQEILRQGNFQLVAVLDESVLHRLVGGPAIMRQQIGHLLDAERRSRATVRILPWSAGAPPSHGGGFEVFKLPDPYSDVGYVETVAGAMYLEQQEAEGLAHRFQEILTMSADEKDSMVIMKDVMSRLSQAPA